MTAAANTIRLNRPVAHDVRTLGPGRRSHILVQGCPLACRGCMASDTHPRRGDITTGVHERSITELVAELGVQRPDGVSITGGEPFAQAEALNLLVQTIRSMIPDADVIVWSGYTLDELIERGHGQLIESLDGLVDGRFIESLSYGPDDPTPKVPRGSTNQRLHVISELGSVRFGDGNTPIDRAPSFNSVGVSLADSGVLVFRTSGVNPGTAQIIQRISRAFTETPPTGGA